MLRGLILEDIQRAVGGETVEKLCAVYVDREVMECRRYFRYGVRLGLELLGLLV